MATLDNLFEDFLSSIEPSKQAVKRAKKAHKELREDLEKDETFGPFVERSLLSGSYGRGTAILHIKDVDVIIQTTFTKNELHGKKRDDETEQECLLRLTQEAIRRTGRVARTRKARRSIYVKLPEEINDIGENIPELTMDIVPVLIQTDRDTDPMTIADRELCAWYNTYPISQLADSVERNAKSNEIGGRHMYKPLVKMFKAWKQAHFRSTKTPKCFILECLSAEYHNPEAKHWVEAVHDLFDNISNRWPDSENLVQIPEASDISDQSATRIPIAKTVEEAAKVLKKIHQHRALLKQAIEEAETDISKSAKTLQRVFGQDCEIVCFPVPSDGENGDGNNGKASRQESSPFVAGSRSDVTEAPEFG